MHVLRFFLTSPSAAIQGRAPARRCIRVLTRGPRPLSLPSAHPLALLGRTCTPSSSAFPVLSHRSVAPQTRRSNPIAHRVRRKRQRLPPSLLIENASDRASSSTRSVLSEAFPIKASDHADRIRPLPTIQQSDALEIGFLFEPKVYQSPSS